MTREQAINYLISSGFTQEQVGEVVRALTYEPTPKNNLGVDCISREQAKAAIRDKFKDLPPRVEINTILNDLPSVTPQPRKGHWIKGYTFPDGEYWKCDKCNELIKVKYPMHYCNNCGSDNREVEV